MAKYKKKRARQLQHDRFRDATMGYFDRAAHKLEGKGRRILYSIAAVAALALITWGVVAWLGRRNDQAAHALGRAIKVTETPVQAVPVPGSTAASFRTEKERAQRAYEEFQKVVAGYGGSTGEFARYFSAMNQIQFDRPKAVAELEALVKSGVQEIAILSKFALAQAREADSKFDDAAAIYKELAQANNSIITPDTANLRLAMVLDRLGKRSEAVEVLVTIAEASRQAKDKDGKAAPQSGAARKAEEMLERLDSDRFSKLTPKALPGNLSL